MPSSKQVRPPARTRLKISPSWRGAARVHPERGAPTRPSSRSLIWSRTSSWAPCAALPERSHFASEHRHLLLERHHPRLRRLGALFRAAAIGRTRCEREVRLDVFRSSPRARPGRGHLSLRVQGDLLPTLLLRRRLITGWTRRPRPSRRSLRPRPVVVGFRSGRASTYDLAPVEPLTQPVRRFVLAGEVGIAAADARRLSARIAKSVGRNSRRRRSRHRDGVR